MASISRRTFAAAAAAFAAFGPRGRAEPARAGIALSGEWCLPLTKTGRDSLFDFTLELLDGAPGATWTLSDQRGKAVWLNFFASWCPPCNAEAPNIEAMWRRYRAQGLRVVGVDVEETDAKARGFCVAHGLTYPIVLDRTGSIYHSFDFRGMPSHMFVDAAGLITCVSLGDLTPTEMDNEVAVALAGRSSGKTRVAATRDDGSTWAPPTEAPKPTAPAPPAPSPT